MGVTKPQRPNRADEVAVLVFVLCSLAALSGGILPHTFTQAQTVDVSAALVGAAGIAAALALFLASGVSPLRSRLGVAWTAFVVWALVAALFSGRALAAFIGEPTNMLGWLTIASLAAVATWAASRGSDSQRMLASGAPWVLAVQIAVVALSLARFGGSDGAVMDLLARGTLPNSTALGELAVLLLPWTVGMTAEKGRPVRWWRVALSASVVAVLLIGQSRIALLVASVWALRWILGQTRLNARMRTMIVGTLLVAALGAVMVFSAIQLRDPSGGQLGLRPEFTRVGIAAVASSPLTGFGPDGFVAGGALVSTPEFTSRIVPLVFMRGATDPHSLLVWVAVSTGLVGLALFVWALVETLLMWIARARAGVTVAPGVWAVVGALVVFLTAPAAVAVLPLFAFSLGASLYEGTPDRGTRPQGKKVLRVALAAVLAFSGLLLATDAMARLPLERADAQRSPALARRAQSMASLFWADPYLSYLASQHWGWSAQSDPAVNQGRFDLVAIERAADLDSRDPFVALERARTARYYRLPAVQVEAAFLEALRRWPAYPLAHAEFAEYLYGLGRQDEAAQQLSLIEEMTLYDQETLAVIERVRSALDQAP